MTNNKDISGNLQNPPYKCGLNVCLLMSPLKYFFQLVPWWTVIKIDTNSEVHIKFDIEDPDNYYGMVDGMYGKSDVEINRRNKMDMMVQKKSR